METPNPLSKGLNGESKAHTIYESRQIKKNAGAEKKVRGAHFSFPRFLLWQIST